ncbi:unnamed protein product [Dibothriocephalus latus]|uniref:Uncharacterized protein n=1 Tax=Dibothriocephalus latus TaxID=60516 RepID=A0A3P6TLQ5_DIBLA|nr:unnamed protein product [Dibothriocephalus latus]
MSTNGFEHTLSTRTLSTRTVSNQSQADLANGTALSLSPGLTALKPNLELRLVHGGRDDASLTVERLARPIGDFPLPLCKQYNVPPTLAFPPSSHLSPKEPGLEA